MEILSKGQPPAERSYVATCRECLTRIRFRRHEAQRIPTQDERPHPLGSYISVPCPQCQASILVQEGDYEKPPLVPDYRKERW